MEMSQAILFAITALQIQRREFRTEGDQEMANMLTLAIAKLKTIKYTN